jgi:hypothetical protein
MKQLLMKTNAQEFMFKVCLFSVCWGADDVLWVSTLTQMVSEFPWAMMLACLHIFILWLLHHSMQLKLWMRQ